MLKYLFIFMHNSNGAKSNAEDEILCCGSVMISFH